MSLLSDVHSYPGIEPAYLLAEKVVAGIACSLSILGAFFVIFHFFYDTEESFKCKEAFKVCCGYKIKVRDGDKAVTKYKLKSYHFILINLSVADIIVAFSHLWGLGSNLENKFLPNITAAHLMNESGITSGYDISCTTQAIFTTISTLSSFFWTDILAVFLAFSIFFKDCSNNFITGHDGAAILMPRAGEEGNHTYTEVPKNNEAPNCCETPTLSSP